MFESIQEHKKEITRIFQKMLSAKTETKEEEYLLHKEAFLIFVSSILEEVQRRRPPVEVTVPQYIEEDKRLVMRSKKTSMKELFERIEKKWKISLYLYEDEKSSFQEIKLSSQKDQTVLYMLQR